MYVIGISCFLACSKKPAPTKPGPAPEKDYGSETAIADAGRGRDLSEMGFRKHVEYAPVYFDLNEAAIRPDQRETLGRLAEDIRKRKACTIIGHACPLGSAIYNQALGYHRAQAVLTYLRTVGVRTGFQVGSQGEESPVTEDPAEYWRNRRAVVACE